MGATRRTSRATPQQCVTGSKAQSRAGTPPMSSALPRDASPAPEPAATTPMPLPTEEEVIAAIASLYDDELKPYGRILRKRIAEHAGVDGSPAPEVDGPRLRALCEGCQRLHVEAEDGGEWSAVLADRADSFIDVYSTVDSYPESLWSAAAVYFESLENDEAGALPGGRYASAFALAGRKLPFLEGRSLGQVCHITQLAISKHKMLGYYNGAIVPYSRSTSRLKLRCAEEQRRVGDKAATAEANGGAPALPVADWDIARRYLREIIEGALNKGAEQVPLSNIKRIFRSVYQMELSETALGHAKLSDLLQDPRVEDICTVQLQDRGYSVLPSASLRQQKVATVGVDECEVVACQAQEASNNRLRFCPDEPLCMEDAMEASLPFPVMTPSPFPQYFGLALGSSGSDEKEEVPRQVPEPRLRFCTDEPLCMEDAMEPASLAFPSMTPSPSPQQYSGAGAGSAPLFLQPWAADIGLGFRQFDAPPMQPAPTAPPGFLQFDAPFVPPAPMAPPAPIAPPTTEPVGPSRKLFCPDEPLCLEEAGPARTEEAWASPAFPAWTPSPQYHLRTGRGLHHQLNDLLAPEEPRVVHIAGYV